MGYKLDFILFQPPKVSSVRVFHTSLGFQLHFIDIFLEELAKIGGEDLPAETINTLIQPFINELARGDEYRLCQHIEERIFQHLVNNYLKSIHNSV